LRSGEEPNLRFKYNLSSWSISTKSSSAVWGHSGCSKSTVEYFQKRGNAGASLYGLVDFWQLENAVKLKELMDLKLAPQPEALDLDISDLFKTDSEQECVTEDQDVGTEPQIVPDAVETSEPPLKATPDSSLKERAKSQATADRSPNNLRRRLDSSIRSPLATFAIGAFAAREFKPYNFLTFLQACSSL
jgi:hypothetical protein